MGPVPVTLSSPPLNPSSCLRLGSPGGGKDKNWTKLHGSHSLLWAGALNHYLPSCRDAIRQSRQAKSTSPVLKPTPKTYLPRFFSNDLPIAKKLTPSLLPKPVSVPWHPLLVPPLGLCSGLALALQALPAPSHLYRPFPSSTAQFKTRLKFSLVLHPTSGSSEILTSDSPAAPLRSGQHGHVTYHVCELHPQIELEPLQHNA